MIIAEPNTANLAGLVPSLSARTQTTPVISMHGRLLVLPWLIQVTHY